MRVTLLLADAAEAVNGKLYILGGGWSVIGPDPSPTAIAVKVEVPWDEANKKHRLELALFDADGKPFGILSPKGAKEQVEINTEFEVGRPPGLKPGTPLDLVLAFNIIPLQLTPDSRYVWRLKIDDRSDENWQVTFTTRASRKA